MAKRILILAAVTALLLPAGAGGLFWAGRSAAQETGSEPELIVYMGEDFTGRSLRITDSLLDMPLWKDDQGQEHSWNDAISSVVVVRGTWRLAEHGRANTRLDETKLHDLVLGTKEPSTGWSCLLSGSETGPVAYDRDNGFFAPRAISSIQLVSSENLPAWAFSRSQ